ncbi:GlsB/YeaQ/YmgE family stress response membrane protein [Bacillus cereus]
MRMILLLIIGGLLGALAGWLTRKHVPGGMMGHMLVGLIGSVLGSTMLGRFGSSWRGIFLIPALIGSIVLLILFALAAMLISMVTNDRE